MVWFVLLIRYVTEVEIAFVHLTHTRLVIIIIDTGLIPVMNERVFIRIVPTLVMITNV